jgi:hypothetical protein
LRTVRRFRCATTSTRDGYLYRFRVCFTYCRSNCINTSCGMGIYYWAGDDS